MQYDDETHSAVTAGAADLDRPRLVALWSGGTAAVLLPERGQVLIGRSASCDLRIDDGSVSREHAIVRVGSPPTLEDLGSSNGTRVAGETVAPGRHVALTGDCTAQLGEALLVLQTRARGAERTRLPARERSERANDPMVEVLRLSDLVATGDISVILRGETGVGKEVLAARIHARSARAEGPFLKLNCAAFSESMVESELFGHEKGAFTGATQAKPGLLEAANGGTVLLDELGELSLPTQAKLLRALGSREVLRVGATRPRSIDVRFLAATHRDLEAMVERGEFRGDLYFRLNGIALHVPPLRARTGELFPLAEEFTREAARRAGLPPPALSDEARELLRAHAWPGNVRELSSVMERAVLLSRGATIQPAHLGLSVSAPAPARVEPEAPSSLRNDLSRVEMERIQAALDASGGNQTKAAQTLGISRRALLHRLDAYGFPRPRKGLDG